MLARGRVRAPRTVTFGSCSAQGNKRHLVITWGGRLRRASDGAGAVKAVDRLD